MDELLRLGVLVSGEGTTLDALSDAIARGEIRAEIALVASDRPEARALERARLRNLPTFSFDPRDRSGTPWPSALSEELHRHRAELVVLAGFLSILPPEWVAAWEGRAINLHPSLLPKFGGPGMHGLRVYAAVLASGAAETGATVHSVTSDVDAGPALLQERIPILAGDSPERLRERLRPVEVRLLLEVIRRFATGTFPLPYRAPEPPGPAATAAA
ncbi:MAG: phosphoribosylglycinamide formyltransferase, partial [Thermoplasmata archaeon]